MPDFGLSPPQAAQKAATSSAPLSSAEVEAIEVDDHLDPDYMNLKTNAASETTSLASSLNKWLEENGRRYHAYYGEGKNIMPVDNIEQERLDIHHEIMTLLMNGALYLAPLEEVHRVLDVGTGTGIWAIEFADHHKEAEVIGVDLSPIQPRWVPSNCKFEVDDLELEWTYPENYIDFIHIRNLCHSIKDWPRFLAQAMKCLRPGGYIELGEIGQHTYSDDNTMPKDWPPHYAHNLLQEALVKMGRNVPTAGFLKGALESANFEIVRTKDFKHPLGPWPKKKNLKEAGGLFVISTETGYHAYGMHVLTNVLGWTREDADKLCKDCHQCHLDAEQKVHAYSYYHKVVARKPFNAS